MNRLTKKNEIPILESRHLTKWLQITQKKGEINPMNERSMQSTAFVIGYVSGEVSRGLVLVGGHVDVDAVILSHDLLKAQKHADRSC